MKNRLLLIGSLMCGVITSNFAQVESFNFKRKIEGVTMPGWYSLPLPVGIPGSANQFHDIRIYNLTDSDTLEVPYLLKIQEDAVSEKNISVPVLNKSIRDGKLYVTFEIPTGERANYLHLEFTEKNFDGHASIEGSNNQKEWFSILNQRRILSIKDEAVDFNFTTLYFPLSIYRFLRVSVEANTLLTFLSATVKRRETKYGATNKIPLTWTEKNNKKDKQTVIDIPFSQTQLFSSLKMNVSNEGDYYRSFELDVLTDSAKSQKGWQYYYENVTRGYLTSADTNAFTFPYHVAKRLRLTINHADNPPLSIKQIEACGPNVLLISKISPGENYLFYGNRSVDAPSYDLKYFEENIPIDLAPLSLGAEEDIRKPAIRSHPLFEKKLWLWGAMGLVILILGFFTLRMLKK